MEAVLRPLSSIATSLNVRYDEDYLLKHDIQSDKLSTHANNAGSG